MCVSVSVGAGHIRIYRVNVNELTAEICAHVRPITGLCLHATDFMFASSSEDQHMQLWSCPGFSGGARDVDLLYSSQLENRKLTGVAFLPDDMVGVVSYDEDDLILFELNTE